MKGITQILKNHKWAIIIAFVAAIIVAFPQLYLRYDNQDSYQGIELFGINDEIAWLSRVREASDGYPALGNAYFKDGKDAPYIIQPLGSAIIAYLGKPFSLDINNTILLSRLLLSFLVFLIIYGFIYFLSRTKLTALATSSFLFLGNSLFNSVGIFNVLAGESPSLRYVNYTRPVNPLMTSFFFFGFLLCFWLFLERKQWRWGILSTLLLGLSFYDYFYTWTFLYAFVGVLILIFFFQKKWLDLKRVGLVLLGASIIAIPYIINLYQATTYPTYAEVGQRVGLMEGRGLTFGFLVPSLFILFLLFFPRKWKERYFFSLALIIAPFIVLNQQIITNKVLQSGHYHWYFHLPLTAVFLLLMFFYWISRKGWHDFKKTVAISIIIISILTGILVQNSSYAEKKEGIIEWQRYGPVMNWLNENAGKDEVVFADNATAFLVVIYTPLNVFYHPSVGGCLTATTERLTSTMFLYYRLAGVDSSEAERVFTKDRLNISKALYGMYFREPISNDQYLPDEVLSDLIQQYQELLSVSTSDFFKEMLEKYWVKYLVWDTKNNPFWQLDQYPFLEKAAVIDDFIIYQK